jgi:hypothetical protein
MIPINVYKICRAGGYIVGSAAKKLAGQNIEYNDIDIIVPYQKWHQVASIIPDSARMNSFNASL